MNIKLTPALHSCIANIQAAAVTGLYDKHRLLEIKSTATDRASALDAIAGTLSGSKGHYSYDTFYHKLGSLADLCTSLMGGDRDGRDLRRFYRDYCIDILKDLRDTMAITAKDNASLCDELKRIVIRPGGAMLGGRRAGCFYMSVNGKMNLHLSINSFFNTENFDPLLKISLVRKGNRAIERETYLDVTFNLSSEVYVGDLKSPGYLAIVREINGLVSEILNYDQDDATSEYFTNAYFWENAKTILNERIHNVPFVHETLGYHHDSRAPSLKHIEALPSYEEVLMTNGID